VKLPAGRDCTRAPCDSRVVGGKRVRAGAVGAVLLVLAAVILGCGVPDVTFASNDSGSNIKDAASGDRLGPYGRRLQLRRLRAAELRGGLVLLHQAARSRSPTASDPVSGRFEAQERPGESNSSPSGLESRHRRLDLRLAGLDPAHFQSAHRLFQSDERLLHSDLRHGEADAWLVQSELRHFETDLPLFQSGQQLVGLDL
jgi:hypothetical protein